MAQRIQFRNDTAANWTSYNPVLMLGELGLETDTGKFKLGDGTKTWTQLSYGQGLINDIPISQVINLTSSLSTITSTLATKAPIDNPTFTGTVNGSFSGSLSGNASSATTADKMATGTSFPSSPSAGQTFYRTDQKIAYIYNGTAWDTMGSGGVQAFLLMGA